MTNGQLQSHPDTAANPPGKIIHNKTRPTRANKEAGKKSSTAHQVNLPPKIPNRKLRKKYTSSNYSVSIISSGIKEVTKAVVKMMKLIGFFSMGIILVLQNVQGSGALQHPSILTHIAKESPRNFLSPTTPPSQKILNNHRAQTGGIRPSNNNPAKFEYLEHIMKRRETHY